MKCVHGAGAVRVAHELVDVAAPGFLCVVAGRRLEGSKDGREEGRGRGRDPPVTFSKAGKDENNPVTQCRPPASPAPSAVLPGLPWRWLRGPRSASPIFDSLF